MASLFTERSDVHGHVYRDVRQSVYRSLRSGKTRSKTKRATKDTPAVFGTYLRPALDKAHFVHLKMHSLDNTAWARYFVTYFRQYLLTEVGSRLQPVSALNFIPRQAFKQLQDNDIELYGIYIIVEHKQGNAPFYTY